MKYIFAALFFMIASMNYSQEIKFNISARNKSVTVSLDDNNDEASLIFPAAQNLKQDYLTVTILNKENDAEWKRSFMLYDSNDNDITDFKLMRAGEYCADLRKISPALEKNKNYSVYTVAVPTDPKKAMLVKPARRLICKIKIE